MTQASKFSLQAAVLMSLILPTSASAGIISKLEAQCMCLTEQITVGQVVSLSLMLILITGIIVLKWIYRDELDKAALKEKSEAEHAAIQTIKELKIGARFSNWTSGHRLAGQR